MAQTILAQAGTTLFHVAAYYLGNAADWSRIALVNNIADPFLTSPQTLTLPVIQNSQVMEGPLINW